jgi:tetratricopeptide (TPR) repeat protein
LNASRLLTASFVITLTLSLMTPALVRASTAEVIDEQELRAEAELHLMAGELAAGRKQPRLAAHELLQALEVFEDKDLASRATHYALSAGDADLALAGARRWLALDPTALEAREVIARMETLRGNANESFTQALELVKANPQGSGEGLIQMARMLSQADTAQADTALTVMNRLVAQYLAVAQGRYALALVALRFNKLDIADTASLEAIKLDPDSRDNALLRIGVLIRLKRLDDADSALAKMLEDEKKPAELRMAYVKLLLESNQRDAARQQLQTLLKDEPDYPDALYALGIISLNDKNYAVAESQFKPLLSGERAQDAAFQLGRLAEAKGDYTQALEFYSRVTKGNLVLDAAIRRAYALTGLQQADAAQQLMAELRDQLPQLAARLYLAEADMLVQNKQLDRALVVYNTALAEFPDDEEMLYGRSIVYERQKKIDLAANDLRTMLTNNAKDARALNALGYMLTVHTRRYQAARKYIARALELTPNDPAVMDSLGWVQFKLGQKKEALSLLKSAYEQFPDPEVAAHLGEVQWSLGNKDEARSIWNKALSDADDNDTLKATIKRLDK